MAPPDNTKNQLEQTNEQTTPGRRVRFYHLKTLLWTYLVWAILNLSCAFHFSGFTTTPPLRSIPYYWKILNICPLWGLIMTLLEGDTEGFVMILPGLVGGLSAVVGLLIKERYGRFLIIIGMSVWFLTGSFVLGLGV